MMRPSMQILAREHVALRGVARVIKIDAELLARGELKDPAVFGAVVAYLQKFPDKIHHPKEEQFLFRTMRQRDPSLSPKLDRLYREHQDEQELIRAFADAYAAFRPGDASSRAVLVQAATDYADFIIGHIEYENEEVFSHAEEVLLDEDWAEIDAAFVENEQLAAGAKDQEDRVEEMRRRIMVLGLPPMGMEGQ